MTGNQPGWLAPAQRVVGSINRVFVALSGALAVAIMVVILQDVVRRYVFNDPSTWALDVSSFMLMYLFFLALAPALESGSHVTVDLFNQILPARLKRPLAILGCVLVVAFGTVLLIQLLHATVEAFEDNNLFPTATPMRVKYIWIVGPVGTAQFVATAALILARAGAGEHAADTG